MGLWIIEENLPIAPKFDLNAAMADFVEQFRAAVKKPDCVVVIAYDRLRPLFFALKDAGFPVQHYCVTRLQGLLPA